MGYLEVLRFFKHKYIDSFCSHKKNTQHKVLICWSVPSLSIQDFLWCQSVNVNQRWFYFKCDKGIVQCMSIESQKLLS